MRETFRLIIHSFSEATLYSLPDGTVSGLRSELVKNLKLSQLGIVFQTLQSIGDCEFIFYQFFCCSHIGTISVLYHAVGPSDNLRWLLPLSIYPRATLTDRWSAINRMLHEVQGVYYYSRLSSLRAILGLMLGANKAATVVIIWLISNSHRHQLCSLKIETERPRM